MVSVFSKNKLLIYSRFLSSFPQYLRIKFAHSFVSVPRNFSFFTRLRFQSSNNEEYRLIKIAPGLIVSKAVEFRNHSRNRLRGATFVNQPEGKRNDDDDDDDFINVQWVGYTAHNVFTYCVKCRWVDVCV